MVKWVVCGPQGIVSWLKKRTGPPAKVIEDVKDLNKMRDSASVVVVGFFGESEDALVKTFEEAAGKADDKIEFALVRSADIAKSLEEKVHTCIYKSAREARR